MFGVVLAVIFLYNLCDVNYFIKTYLTIWFGRLFQRTYKLHETTSFYGICTTNDVGITLHMRPSRMFRELDFARWNFWERTGVYDRSVSLGMGAVQGASQVILVEPLPLLAPYRIDTKLVYWNDKSLLMDHLLVNLLSGRTCAILTSRVIVTGAGADTTKVLGGLSPSESPKCPEDDLEWMQSMEIVSANLRKK